MEEASTLSAASSGGGSPSLAAVAAVSAEESGWTVYFEDLYCDEPNYSTSVGVGSSLLSDAASCVAWKLPAEAAAAASASEGGKKLSFKRRKAKGVLNDDSLEDTASSPLNSPKISEMNHLSLNQRKKDEGKHFSESGGKDFGLEGCTEEGRREGRDGFGLVDGSGNECTELKKRGLCLVPLSMLVDYLG